MSERLDEGLDVRTAFMCLRGGRACRRDSRPSPTRSSHLASDFGKSEYQASKEDPEL